MQGQRIPWLVSSPTGMQALKEMDRDLKIKKGRGDIPFVSITCFRFKEFEFLSVLKKSAPLYLLFPV